jgi:hypothetical protein
MSMTNDTRGFVPVTLVGQENLTRWYHEFKILAPSSRRLKLLIGEESVPKPPEEPNMPVLPANSSTCTQLEMYQLLTAEYNLKIKAIS